MEISKELFEIEYIGKNKTFNQISKETGITAHRLKYWAKVYKIETRRGGRKSQDLSGLELENIKVIKISDRICNKHPLWECICKCGNITYKTYSDLNLNPKLKCWDCRNKEISQLPRP